MSVKTRLAKLEENHAAKAGQQVTYDSEKNRQWLVDTVQSIKNGTHIPMPRKPLAPDASPTAIWLGNLLPHKPAP